MINYRFHSFSFVFVALLLAACGTKQIPDADMKSAAKKQANEFAQAVLSGDFQTEVNKMYPQIITAVGGRDKVVAQLKDWTSQQQQLGVKTDDILIGNVDQIGHSSAHQFAIVPEAVTMTTPAGKASQKSFLFGISDDGGNNWTFIDGVGLDQIQDKLKVMLPDLPADFNFPPQEKPVKITTPPPAGTN